MYVVDESLVWSPLSLREPPTCLLLEEDPSLYACFASKGVSARPHHTHARTHSTSIYITHTSARTHLDVYIQRFFWREDDK
jgi:hypothetical protein